MGIYFVLRRNFILEGTNWLFKDMVTSLCAISDGWWWEMTYEAARDKTKQRDETKQRWKNRDMRLRYKVERWDRETTERWDRQDKGDRSQGLWYSNHLKNIMETMWNLCEIYSSFKHTLKGKTK